MGWEEVFREKVSVYQNFYDISLYIEVKGLNIGYVEISSYNGWSRRVPNMKEGGEYRARYIEGTIDVVTASVINNGQSIKKYATVYENDKGNRIEANGYVIVEEYNIPPKYPPSAPSSITVPTAIKGGESINISWGTGSGATSYYLSRSVNGEAYSQIYSGSSRSYTDEIAKSWNTVVYRVRAYNSDGFSGYTTSPTRTIINNTSPIISGQDSNLGDKNLGFVISYQVDDSDAGDSLIVTEKLNGATIKTINGAPRKQGLEIEITNETLYSLELNGENTIEIKVDDQKGGIAYRRYTFRRTNTAPIIDGQDEDLGQKLEPFSIDFSASDNEGNEITVKTYLDGIKKEEYQVEDRATNTFTISSEDWYKLGIGTHSIKIEAIDEHGATAIRNYTFTRYDDKIQFTLKNPIETDITATKILVTPTWVIPIGATVKVEVCNNGYDEVSTWEDITSQVSTGKHYIFTNDVKTADKWGINIRFTIEKGTAIEECVIHGFGGAFE
ncbi:hypothetical protein KQI38_15620 [Tissierella carlieri]|uniref:Fibronectin type-III domain-containing protein n=1 Tax=Tissierella carlieri TaxID=689904 RepID=A0ABT1SE49_9FIRM|nr:hypothetical protein [Tissierella carlieri]MBU5313450.1 hypothetical protein [Tissierella carlieri]MCQ4924761.1 hypothetical protein [Tissierella carlieri]